MIIFHLKYLNRRNWDSIYQTDPGACRPLAELPGETIYLPRVTEIDSFLYLLVLASLVALVKVPPETIKRLRCYRYPPIALKLLLRVFTDCSKAVLVQEKAHGRGDAFID